MSVNIYDPSTGLLAPVAGVNTALVNSKADKSTIAPVETNSTASQSYTIGEQFYYGGILRKATLPIAANDTITPGTNCDLSDEVSSQIYGLQTKANNKVLFLTSVACSATTGNFASVSNSAITADHVVVECSFANPSSITSDVTWTTGNGTLTLNGTCAKATTATITLAKKDN